jgi:hypothetical protein
MNAKKELERALKHLRAASAHIERVRKDAVDSVDINDINAKNIERMIIANSCQLSAASIKAVATEVDITARLPGCFEDVSGNSGVFGFNTTKGVTIEEFERVTRGTVTGQDTLAGFLSKLLAPCECPDCVARRQPSVH